MKKELFIITGSSGKLGQSFIDILFEKKQEIIALSRKEIHSGKCKGFVVDLLDKVNTEKTIQSISFEEYDIVTLIHTVGKFKFEEKESPESDADGDGIDDEVYQTNVVTLKNILQPLIRGIGSKKLLRICTFASVSDKYNIPFWASYTKAKNVLRAYLRAFSDDGYLSALVVNVSTVDTGNENLLRPNADKTYWLKTEEIVSRVLPELDILTSYKEIDIIKKKPEFDEAYYSDHEAILKKWRQEITRINEI